MVGVDHCYHFFLSHDGQWLPPRQHGPPPLVRWSCQGELACLLKELAVPLHRGDHRTSIQFRRYRPMFERSSRNWWPDGPWWEVNTFSTVVRRPNRTVFKLKGQRCLDRATNPMYPWLSASKTLPEEIVAFLDFSEVSLVRKSRFRESSDINCVSR